MLESIEQQVPRNHRRVTDGVSMQGERGAREVLYISETKKKKRRSKKVKYLTPHTDCEGISTELSVVPVDVTAKLLAVVVSTDNFLWLHL